MISHSTTKQASKSKENAVIVIARFLKKDLFHFRLGVRVPMLQLVDLVKSTLFTNLQYHLSGFSHNLKKILVRILLYFLSCKHVQFSPIVKISRVQEDFNCAARTIKMCAQP